MRFQLFFLILLMSSLSEAQSPADTSGYRTIVAGKKYEKTSVRYLKHWGQNRRAEWTTGVSVPELLLDNIGGGLKPYQAGGGNESKSLRLESADGKQYTLRSIDKSRDDVVDSAFKKTFIEALIIDGVSSSYPYGSFAVAGMQAHAGIYHTDPRLVYLPAQKSLDTFNARFAEDLYLFEQRLDGDWSESENLGYFKSFSSTDKVIEKLLDNNKNVIDQPAFLKARLFDMLIGDWDRHEDNWRWGKSTEGGITRYVPVPRDRDQAFYTHNGRLLDLLLPAAGLAFMQNFDSTVRNIHTLNKEEWNMDRFLLNGMSLADWINIARQLQESLSDAVIEESVGGLPPEIFAISGNELIRKLISRRGQLVDFATAYYLFISKEAEVTGTREREYFEVRRMANAEVSVKTFRINEGRKDEQPYYRRTFKADETSEIRIFGIGGEDIFSVEGQAGSILLRIIGGPSRDSIIQKGPAVKIYDDRNNVFQTSGARLSLSKEGNTPLFTYKSFTTDSKGFSPELSYNNEDRLYVGLKFSTTKHHWPKVPFAVRHTIGIRYSISQHAVSACLGSLFPQVLGKWGLFLDLNYDAVRWTNFYGLGDNNVLAIDNVRYYRMHSGEWDGQAGLRRTIGKGTVDMALFFKSINLDLDPTRYLILPYPEGSKDIYGPNYYGGLRIHYDYACVNNAVLPTKGINLYSSASLVNNFTQAEFFQDYLLKCQGWLPLGSRFSLAVRVGAETIVGNPGIMNNAQLPEHAVIGGAGSLRGFRRERFWGKSSFYNENELRFISNIHFRFMNARAGLFSFFDDGRVWVPGEKGMLHTSYGGGILFAPFNMVCLAVSYGISDETTLLQFRVRALF